MEIHALIQLFNILQNDVEPLPEPWRTILLALFLLGALVIPLLACIVATIRRRRTRRIVEEMGSSWKGVSDRIPKPEDAMIENIECIAIVILVVFAGLTLVLIQIVGPIIQNIAIIILMGFAIVLIVIICPIAMIWGMRVEDRRNSERIKLAEENRKIRETGEDT